jgi:ribosomal protein S18 acetylase RimI-like enzyme
LSQTFEQLTNTDLAQDAKRFQEWQRDALEARPAGSQLLSLGPFRAVIPGALEPGRWVTIVEGPVTKRDTSEAAARLRSMFEHDANKLEIEFDEVAFPVVGGWLEAAGLERVERHPLMASRPKRFKPFAAPGVTVSRLATGSQGADMESFQTIRWTNGGDNDGPIASVDQLQEQVESPRSVYLLAWLDGQPAGTGVSHSLKGAAEIVGIVTRADKRRRGVAATVTSELVARHFTSGGDFAFLDAADEGAVKLYEGLGFETFGANVVYRS